MRYIIVYLLIFFAGVFSYSFAAKVSPDNAQKVAITWKTYIHTQQLKSNKSILLTPNSQLPTIIRTTYSVYLNDTTFYTFSFQGGGFVIVAADDNINPILAYSDTDSIPEYITNENIKYWLNKFNKQIYKSINQQINNSTNQQQWNNILQNNFAEKSVNKVGPLLSTTWDQVCYYNSSCPDDNNGPCGHVVTGCVATALAQIMKYNNYPPKGTGSYSYADSSYGTLSANFGNTTYNWTDMPNSVTSKNNAVATLMFQCGVAVNMQYSPTGSASDGQNAVNALNKYFGYPSASYIAESNYNISSWESIIKGNLDLSLSLYYEGIDVSIKEGHAFVCDGYDFNSAGDYFHFNWGWSGQCDGYFLLSALDPDPDPQYNFSSYESAIINIIPGSISGTLLYDNAKATDLTGQKIILTNLYPASTYETQNMTTTTDGNGGYIFNNVTAGTYTIIPEISLTPGGFNPIDALLCNKFTNKLYKFTDSLLLHAAEVNSEKNVNSSDALLINQRYIGIISSFAPRPDWTYLQNPVQVLKSNVSQNCTVVCTGDVNASYNLSVQKLTDFSVLTKDTNINIQINREFEMPVYINDTVKIGALGLFLSLSDTMFQIEDVTPNINLTGLIYKAYGNKVNIAWSADDSMGYKIQPSIPLFYLKIICKGVIFGEELNFLVNDGSLIADFNGNAFDNENIVFPKLTFQDNFNECSVNNYPNPFTRNTNIQLIIPTDAQVNIKIYDYTGRLVSTVVDEYMVAGVYDVPFLVNGLHSGIYYYRAEINNSNHITGKMVIIQ